MPTFLSDSERSVAAAIAGLSDTNPFLPGRIDLEREALADRFVGTGDVWRVEATLDGLNPNLRALTAAVEQLVPKLRDRLRGGARATAAELELYEALVRYLLYQRYETTWFALIERGEAGRSTTTAVSAYTRFAHDVDDLLGFAPSEAGGPALPVATDPEHLFAWGFQIRRAFYHTFRRIYGGSLPAARLRAAVWQSVFTHDPRRYRRVLFERMNDLPTLIVGESGTGKELVARAIGLSRWVPFDAEARCFREDYAKLFHPLNIAALPAPLVESELFGHKRGAFTGALADRSGWLETCTERGAVFLDEIGELPAEIQIKLLRVLETRGYNRLGETQERRFLGKIVAATNRDLEAEMQAGRFREDLYFRLCADQIRTPTLREQLRDLPGDLEELVAMAARRIVGEAEADAVADQAAAWIRENLGSEYPWPGNVRELEQCVRSFLVRREYRPRSASGESGGADGWLDRARAGELDADALLSAYCTWIYARTGSYEGAARRLGLDRRTVKAKLDPELLEQLAGSPSSD